MNTELFAKIDEVIDENPQGFDMNYWEFEDGICGTTRCVAGWAAYLHTGEPLFSRDGGGTPSLIDLAEEHDALSDDPDFPVDFTLLGRALLDLPTEAFASSLFHASERKASEFVRLAAQGDNEAAFALFYRDANGEPL